MTVSLLLVDNCFLCVLNTRSLGVDCVRVSNYAEDGEITGLRLG